MKHLLVGLSVLALAATPALAQGNNGNGNRGNNPAASDNARGNGQGNAERGNRANERGNARNERGGPPQTRGNGNGNDNRGGPPAVRGNGNGNAPAVRGNRGNGNGNAPAIRGNRGNGNGNGNNGRGNVSGGGLIDFITYRTDTRRVADGCPPGLARKYNGCRPPGLARQQDGFRRYAPDWWGYRGYGRSGSYFYDDGFLLRIGGDGGISGYIPLLGGALSVGNPWPDDYRYSRMPSYYESYYGLGSPRDYRYADNVIYRMDPETAAIASVAALLTGNEFTVGQPAPRGYDVYNVPYSYRERYYDRPDARYRYNNGYVYEIDPETMLVVSAIQLLT
ncbi:hypothetical protein [Aurantiacibacter gilvus]|uniref:Nickel/cobalt transporter regulator n=1 Tax=Aurantiacibacter gilvus TaxID=3139141 RepID=A0ABU9IAP2_9SPHN